MTFSMELGLFDPEGGCGYNPSGVVLVTGEKGVVLGSKSLTKAWPLPKL